MTTIKINQLPEKSSLIAGDYIIVEDTANSKTTKLNVANLNLDGEPFVEINSTTNFPVASGINAISIGTGVQNSGNYSVSILGFNNKSNSVSIMGDNQGEDGVAIGLNAFNENTAGVALGTQSQCQGDYGTAIGSYAEVFSNGAVALGTSAIANAENAVQIGFANSQPSVANTIRFQESIIANSEGLYTPFTNPANYTPVDNDNVTSHLEAIDEALVNAGGDEPYVEINSTGILPTATGIDSITIGVESNNPSNSSIVIGNFNDVETNGTYSSIVTGNTNYIEEDCYYSQVIGTSSTIGKGSNNTVVVASNSSIGYEGGGPGIPSPYSVAVGESVNINGPSNIAIGNGPKCFQGSEDSISIGSFARTNSTGAISIGKSAFSSGNNTITVGTSASSGQAQAIAIGNSAFVAGDNGIAIGNSASAGSSGDTLPNGINSIAIGENAVAKGAGSIQLGTGISFQSNTLQFKDVIIATENGIISPYTVGQPTYNSDNGALAVGNDGKFYYRSQSTWKTPAGVGASDSEPYVTINPSTTPGALPNVTGTGAIGIGEDTVSNGNKSIALGNSAQASSLSIAIGSNGTIASSGGTALGTTAVASGANSTALGDSTSATSTNTVSIGTGAKATAVQAVQIGSGTNNIVASLQFRDVQIASEQGIKARSETEDPAGAAHFGNFQLNQSTDTLFYYSTGGWIQVATENGNTNAGTTSPLTTKGDIWIHDDSADTRLPVGQDGQVLTASSTSGSGLEWTTIEAQTTEIPEDYLEVNSNGIAPVADGTDSIALGVDANATNTNSIGIGKNSNSVGESSVAIGNESQAGNQNAVAIGEQSKANVPGAVVIGSLNTCNGVNSSIIGVNSNIGNNPDCQVIGNDNLVSPGDNNVYSSTSSIKLFGSELTVSDSRQVMVIGEQNTVTGIGDAVVFGEDNIMTGASSGVANTPNMYNNIQIGNQNIITDSTQSETLGGRIQIGLQHVHNGGASEQTIQLGSSTSIGSNSPFSVAISEGAVVGDNASGAMQLGLGTNNIANTLQFRNVTIATANNGLQARVHDGFSTVASDGSLLVKSDEDAFYFRSNGEWKRAGNPYLNVSTSTGSVLPINESTDSVVLGTNTGAVGTNSFNAVAIGRETKVYSGSSVAIGRLSFAGDVDDPTNSNFATAVGVRAEAKAADSVAVGMNAKLGKNAIGGVAIGRSVLLGWDEFNQNIDEGEYCVAIGNQITLMSKRSVAIGPFTTILPGGQGNIAIGSGASVGNVSNAIQLGGGTNNESETFNYLGNTIASIDGLFVAPTSGTPATVLKSGTPRWDASTGTLYISDGTAWKSVQLS